jgi:prepilin-type N-terminal cleavage/methylation domain-containing protein
MTKHKQKYKQAGFTLIELLVVVSIIGVISSITLVVFKEGRMKARDNQRIANLKQLGTALELYNFNHGVYPTSMSEFGMTNFSTYTTWEGELGPQLSEFMARLPHDPLEPNYAFYYFSGPQATWCLPANGQFLKISRDRGYMLVGVLEEADNPLPQNDGGIYSDRYELRGGEAQIVNTCP